MKSTEKSGKIRIFCPCCGMIPLYTFAAICYAVVMAVITMKKALMIFLGVIVMFSLFGCGKSKQFDIETYLDKPEKTMLVDYYSRTVGTPMQMPYYEAVLYTHSPAQALLEEYTEGGTDEEKVTAYLIPIEGAQEILTAVKNTGMAGWNNKNGIAISGRSDICKFPDGGDGYVRVTSGNMPEDGSKKFGEVAAAMRRWMLDEYLVKKSIRDSKTALPLWERCCIITVIMNLTFCKM